MTKDEQMMVELAKRIHSGDYSGTAVYSHEVTNLADLVLKHYQPRYGGLTLEQWEQVSALGYLDVEVRDDDANIWSRHVLRDVQPDDPYPFQIGKTYWKQCLLIEQKRPCVYSGEELPDNLLVRVRYVEDSLEWCHGVYPWRIVNKKDKVTAVWIMGVDNE